MANIALGSLGTAGFRFDKFDSYDFFDYYHNTKPNSAGVKIYADSKNYTQVTGTGLKYVLEDGVVMGIKSGTITGITQVTNGVKLLVATDINISGAALSDTLEDSNSDRGVALLLSRADKITGTKYADVIYGHGGNDALYGNAGNDKLYGGAGNDTLVGGAGADRLYGGAGTDTASYAGATKGVVANLKSAAGNTNDAKGDSYSSIENLTGSSHSDTLTGNDAANRISGGAGNDRLNGGLGKDMLIGGSGNDTFVFNTKLGSNNIDTISDFSVKDDTIWLDDDIFTKAGKVGDLSTAAFHIGAKAHDASDRVIYDNKTGKLWYDADGTGKGAAVHFAQLDTGLKLTAADFDIIG